jgi:hypothetical protein
MEVVCNKCGTRRNVGGIVQIKDFIEDKERFFCLECDSHDMRLVDSGGINIKVDGINEDTIRAIVSELAKSVSLADLWKFFTKKKE